MHKLANKGDDLLVNTPIPSEMEFIHNENKTINEKLNKNFINKNMPNAMTIGDQSSDFTISSSHTPSSLSFASTNSISHPYHHHHSAFITNKQHWLPDISESYAQLENKFIKLDSLANSCFSTKCDIESAIIASSLHSLRSCNFQLRSGIITTTCTILV